MDNVTAPDHGQVHPEGNRIGESSCRKSLQASKGGKRPPVPGQVPINAADARSGCPKCREDIKLLGRVPTAVPGRPLTALPPRPAEGVRTEGPGQRRTWVRRPPGVQERCRQV